VNEKKNNQNFVQSILLLYHDSGTLSDTDVEVACRIDRYRVRDKGNLPKSPLFGTNLYKTLQTTSCEGDSEQYRARVECFLMLAQAFIRPTA
jgi:hypothetical protein